MEFNGLLFFFRQLQHAASWDPTAVPGVPRLGRDPKNISVGEAVNSQPNCPPEPVDLPVQQQEGIVASSSDYSNSEDEYTHIEDPTPVSDEE